METNTNSITIPENLPAVEIAELNRLTSNMLDRHSDKDDSDPIKEFYQTVNQRTVEIMQLQGAESAH